MLEADQETQPRLLFQLRQGAAQKGAQTAGPILPLEGTDLPQQPVLDGRAITKIQEDFLAGRRHEIKVAMGAEGGLGNASETVDHDIGRCPADTEALALLQIA